MFHRPIILCLLHCITLGTQVSDGRQYFLGGTPVGQPRSRRSLTALEGNQDTTFALR